MDAKKGSPKNPSSGRPQKRYLSMAFMSFIGQTPWGVKVRVNESERARFCQVRIRFRRTGLVIFLAWEMCEVVPLSQKFTKCPSFTEMCEVSVFHRNDWNVLREIWNVLLSQRWSVYIFLGNFFFFHGGNDMRACVMWKKFNENYTHCPSNQ